MSYLLVLGKLHGRFLKKMNYEEIYNASLLFYIEFASYWNKIIVVKLYK